MNSWKAKIVAGSEKLREDGKLEQWVGNPMAPYCLHETLVGYFAIPLAHHAVSFRISSTQTTHSFS